MGKLGEDIIDIYICEFHKQLYPKTLQMQLEGVNYGAMGETHPGIYSWARSVFAESKTVEAP